MIARFLYCSVFITGAALLIIEILANRMLSPYFGSTLYNTSAILATVLGGLSIGYWLGGRLSARQNVMVVFLSTLIVAAFLTILVACVYPYFLSFVQVHFSPLYGSLVSSVVLFLVPSTFFGLLSPLAVVALDQILRQNSLGSKIGNMYAISTMGSIFGSLITGFVLLPLFPIDSILKCIGLIVAVLALTGALITKSKKLIFPATASVILACFSFVLSPFASVAVVASVNGEYNNISVVDGKWNQKPTRFFLMDQQLSAAQYRDTPDELVFDYTQYYDAYKKFGITPKNIAVIGGAAYSIPQAYVKEIADAQVDVYEIESKTIDVANTYFGGAANHPRIHNTIGDARIQMQKNPQQYDVIFIDAYSGVNAIPWQLTTVEFYQIVAQKLAPGGLVISNTISNTRPGSTKVLDSYALSQMQVFGHVSVYDAMPTKAQSITNTMILATNSDKKADSSPMKYVSQERFANSQIDISSLKNGIVLRDNYAPIEYFGLQELTH
jgi:predicted membrane-bound spermidine synthase